MNNITSDLDIVRDGETLGPDRTDPITGEEQHVVSSRNGTNDVATLNPKGSVDTETTKSKRNSMSFSKDHKIGTWNVRTMNIGKLDIVTGEMQRTGVEILGISELKWTERGHFQTGTGNYKVFFSGQRANPTKWGCNNL